MKNEEVRKQKMWGLGYGRYESLNMKDIEAGVYLIWDPRYKTCASRDMKYLGAGIEKM